MPLLDRLMDLVATASIGTATYLTIFIGTGTVPHLLSRIWMGGWLFVYFLAGLAGLECVCHSFSYAATPILYFLDTYFHI
jgi:hypothetical protein